MIFMCHHQFKETGLTWIDGEPLYECAWCHEGFTKGFIDARTHEA